MGSATSAVMRARVSEVREGDLLVRDCRTGQEVLVHTDCAGDFCVGDCVCIHFSGIMTMSLPPQISADSIRCLSHR